MVAGIDYTGISVCFYCHDGNKNFLFQKRSKNCRDQIGKWECGGGKMEFGETPEKALKRELKEEYGCTGKIDFTLPAISFFEKTKNGGKHWLILPFIVKVDRKKVKNCEPKQIDELRWQKISTPPTPLHSSMYREIKVNEKFFKKYI